MNPENKDVCDYLLGLIEKPAHPTAVLTEGHEKVWLRIRQRTFPPKKGDAYRLKLNSVFRKERIGPQA